MSEAVLAHRGISSVLMRFAGRAGHASGKQDPSASALHQAMRWGGKALDHVQSLAHARFGGLTGLRFNIGRVEGGIKANMIAPAAEVRFGFRPLPSMDVDGLLATFAGFAEPAAAHFEETFRGPSLPSGDIARAEERRLAARDVADALDLPIGNAVDFWTEASLFFGWRLHRAGLWPGRYRTSAYRRRIRHAGTVAALRRIGPSHHQRFPLNRPWRLPSSFGHGNVPPSTAPQTDPPDHRAPAFEHGQREGNQPVPQAFLAGGCQALCGGQGGRRRASRRSGRTDLVAVVSAGSRADTDRAAWRWPATGCGAVGSRHRKSTPSTDCA